MLPFAEIASFHARAMWPPFGKIHHWQFSTQLVQLAERADGCMSETNNGNLSSRGSAFAQSTRFEGPLSVIFGGP